MDGARRDNILSSNNYKNLLEKSAFFSKTITYAPFTIAAMHAVFSGTYGNKNGVNSYWASPKFKKNDYKTLASYLHDENYFTTADVINNLVLPKIGFDEFVVHDELHDNLTERHKLLLEKIHSLKKDNKKFFIYLHYSNIHTSVMQEVLKKHDNFSDEYFSNKEKNREFYNSIFNKGDEYLGEIIEYCEKLGLTDDSLIFVMSDHGCSVGEKVGERAYGVFCYDYTLLSTALFCHKNIPKLQIDNQVRSIDILPTILEILGIPVDKNFKKFQGKSLVPIMNGETESRIAFSQSGNPLDNKRPPKEPNVWAIRTDEWKFIKNIHNETEELYNLKDDPDETSNIIDQHPEEAQNLRNELQKLTET